MNLKESLTGWWCDWTHGGGVIQRDAQGRINWQCSKCRRWSPNPVPLAHEEAMTTRDIERALRDKALRFDLDATGIESREREAVELVELRAKVKDLLEYAQHDEACEKWWAFSDGSRLLSDNQACTCGLSELLTGEPGPGGEG